MENLIFKNRLNNLIILFVLLFVFSIHSSYCQGNINKQIQDTIYNKKEFKDWDRFSFGLGYFFAGNNSGISLGSKQLGAGFVIDLEDALSLDVNTFVFRGDAQYAFGKRKRHNVVIDYFRINRNARKVLESELEIGDAIYPIGTTIVSKLDVSVIRAKYDYSFYQDDRVSLGLSFGLFIMPISFSIQSTGTKGQAEDILAPLPVLGLRSSFAITPKIFLKQSAELLYLTVDNFTGNIVDLNIGLEYKTFKHFGFGLNVNSNKLNILAQGNDYPNINFYGNISMEYSGVRIYAFYYF